MRSWGKKREAAKVPVSNRALHSQDERVSWKGDRSQWTVQCLLFPVLFVVKQIVVIKVQSLILLSWTYALKCTLINQKSQKIFFQWSEHLGMLSIYIFYGQGCESFIPIPDDSERNFDLWTITECHVPMNSPFLKRENKIYIIETTLNINSL